MRYEKTTIILISLVVLVIFLVTVVRKHAQQPFTQNLLPSVVSIASSTIPTQMSSTADVKTYRNNEFGFEFQYPQNWKLDENSFGSPFSKFNLEGDSSSKDYNPDMPAFLINVVTSDFAEMAVISMKEMHAIMSNVIIGGTQGVKYEYLFEGVPQVDIYIPFGQYKIIFGTAGQHVGVFNQILASFKFLK